MNKFEIHARQPKVSGEDYISKLDGSIKDIFQDIRRFVLSLGSNVIEEVRPHRIVYSKSFNFRTFLDIEPLNNTLILSVKKRPKDSPNKMNVTSKEQLQDIKDTIKIAYEKI